MLLFKYLRKKGKINYYKGRGENSMKSKLYIILFLLSITSLIISVFQFKRGSTLEAILSIIFFSVFFIGGIIYRARIKREK